MEQHYCTVCFRPVDAHDEHCDVDDCCGHWPALCCPGCGCESFELAHPELAATPPRYITATGEAYATTPDTEPRDTGPTELKHELAGHLHLLVTTARDYRQRAVVAKAAAALAYDVSPNGDCCSWIRRRTEARAYREFARSLIRQARALRQTIRTYYPRPGQPAGALPVTHLEGCIDG